MDTHRVLIVDDDTELVGTLTDVMKGNSMTVESAANGSEGVAKAVSGSYDCILLDINMEEMDGFQALSTIRGKEVMTPIIIVSGRKDDYDMLYGLGLGADDYVTKPFNPVVLAAKVKALIRRAKIGDRLYFGSIKAGPFSYDTRTLRLYKNGTPISLTAKENSLIWMFMNNVNRVFTKNDIYSSIWDEPVMDENAIMVYINRLRQKIEDDPSHPRYIKNVRGMGYMFVV